MNNMKSFFEEDPLFSEMMKGNRSWGNIIEEEERKGPMLPTWTFDLPNSLHARIRTLLKTRSEASYLEGWETPDLRLRKSIWENFPVILDAVNDGDGTDRYAIIWHKDRLDRSGVDIDTQEYRLLYALSKYSNIYALEEPRSPKQIAILTMVHTGNLNRNRNRNRTNKTRRNKGRVANNTRRNTVPTLKRLLDIKEHFPFVLWNEVEGKAGTKTYELGINSKIKHDAKDEERLMTALKASKFWHVLPSKQKKFCRLEMITKKNIA